MAVLSALLYAQDSASIAGKWQLTMDTPHGTVKGDLAVQQDGSKVTGTCSAEPFGSMALSGNVEGKKVSLSLTLPGGDATFGFSGTVDGATMSGTTQLGGAWSATRAGTAAAPKPVLGTVAAFKADTLEFAVKPDNGATVLVKVGPETEVVTIPPGESGLAKAKPAKVTDLALGDRVLVSFVDGMVEARRIVLISADDIARRDEAERLDWQQRGTSGVVASVNGAVVTIEQRTPQGVKTTAVTVTGKTRIRRYAPDSVKFTDAQPGALGEIAVGDQVQARGRKSDDGSRLAADEVVSGTFLTKVGTVTAVNPDSREIVIEDLRTKEALTVRVTAGSQLKMLPDMRAMMSGQPHGAPANEGAQFDIKQVLEHLPAATMADVKAGSTIVVTSTRGANSSQLTAIMLLANADSLIHMAQATAGGGDPMEAINRMHGGVFSGPGGLSLPAILQ
ncbi:conserved hypothetical protein [Candidatus Sulfopaludibacter sp. SbA4]|nr:conserved hypothetical protein [Candidatus Sulfopaludibacter sp. SbA4]